MSEPSRYGWQGDFLVAVEADDLGWHRAAKAGQGMWLVGQGDYTQAEATEIRWGAFIPGAGGDSGE